MKFRVLLMVVLLMICIIIGIIFIKGSSNLYLIQENIISYIEDNYRVEIKFAEISLWPLNQITLKGFEFFSRDSELSLSAARVQIHYNFFNIFNSQPDIENLINNVEMDRPILIVNNMEFKDGGISAEFPITTPFQLTVNKGTIHYSDGHNKASLPEVSLVYQKINRKESRLMIDSGLNLKHLEINGFTLEDLNLNNLELSLLILDQQWQARLESDYLNLNKLLTAVSQLENFPPVFKEPEGSAKIDLDLAGQGFSVNEYRGYLTLRELSSGINIPQLIEDAELRGMEGEILFSSQNDSLYFQNCSFTLEETPCHFEGSLGFNEGEPELLTARLVSEEFEPSSFFATLQEKINPELRKFSPLTELKGKGFLEIRTGGTLPEPGYSLEFHLNEGYYAENKLNNFQLVLSYCQDYLYLNTLDILMNEEALISARGLYNTETMDYNLDLTTSNLDLAMLNTISGIKGFSFLQKDNYSLDEIKGIINLSSTISGCGKDSSELYISGQAELRSPEIGALQLSRLESSFRVTGNQLFLYDGLLASSAGDLDFSGEIGLKDERLKLEILGEELALQSLLPELQPLLGEFFNQEVYNELSGNIDIRGEVLGTFSEPEFGLRAEMTGGRIRGREINELSFNLRYIEEEIIIDGLRLNAENLALSGKGGIILRPDIYLYSDIRVDTSCEVLTEITGQKLPLKGELAGEISINGSPESLLVEGEMSSSNPGFSLPDRELKLDDILFSFRWDKDTLLLKNITARMDDARLEGNGNIEDGLLELDFTLDELSAELLIPEGEIAGMLELQGSITGRLSSPEISGQLAVENLVYSGLAMDKINGGFRFVNGEFLLEDIYGYQGGYSYFLEGKIAGPAAENYSILIKTDRGKLSHLIKPWDLDIPVPEEYTFNGGILVTANKSRPSVFLDLAFSGADAAEAINLKGNIGEIIELSMSGTGVNPGAFPFIQDYNLDINGSLDFEGEIKGSADSFDLNLNTSLSETSINGFKIEKGTGEINIDDSEILSLEQIIFFDENRKIEAKGSIPLQKNEEMLDLKLNVNGFPVELISVFYSDFKEIGGYLAGEVEVEGTIEEPCIDGELYLLEGLLDLDLPSRFTDLQGRIVFNEQEIRLLEMDGSYGDSDIILSGSIYPLEEGNYDISLCGDDLPFDYGSFWGRFDTEIEVKGSFDRPFIKAAARPHDFTVGMPFRWPEGEGGEDIIYDITLEPGENVKLLNENINVLIQEGSLNISNQEGQVEFVGVLSSEQGYFEYYNNKFIISEARATFKHYNSYIPELYVRADTRIEGTIIEVTLTGQPDSLLTTFDSHPPLSEDEILYLLSSKGGLGEFVSGNYENIFSREVMRLLYRYFQVDVVEDIQDVFKKIFTLDRFELDAYNLGWENEISIYAGKYLNDRLYLEYSSAIAPDFQDSELSLRYYINDNLHFKGSWLGEDDYSITLETSLDF